MSRSILIGVALAAIAATPTAWGEENAAQKLLNAAKDPQPNRLDRAAESKGGGLTKHGHAGGSTPADRLRAPVEVQALPSRRTPADYKREYTEQERSRKSRNGVPYGSYQWYEPDPDGKTPRAGNFQNLHSPANGGDAASPARNPVQQGAQPATAPRDTNNFQGTPKIVVDENAPKGGPTYQRPKPSGDYFEPRSQSTIKPKGVSMRLGIDPATLKRGNAADDLLARIKNAG